MSKQEYIHQLKAKLKGLDEKEIEDAITYCEEYFDDAGEGNEEQVIKDLGTPGKFAAQLKAESIIREEETGTKKKNSAFRNFWIVLIGLCALPLAFPILLVVAIILFTVFIIALSLLFALVVSAFAIITSGFPLLVNAFLHLDALKCLDCGRRRSVLHRTGTFAWQSFVLFSKKIIRMGNKIIFIYI